MCAATFDDFTFLKSYIPGHAVTEMEVIYGALGWQKGCCAPCRSAFFYTRSRDFLKRIDQKEMAVFEEKDGSGRRRLDNLKRRIGERVKETR